MHECLVQRDEGSWGYVYSMLMSCEGRHKYYILATCAPRQVITIFKKETWRRGVHTCLKTKTLKSRTGNNGR